MSAAQQSARGGESAAELPGPVLALDDVHVRIGGSHILQGVSLSVAPSGVTALLGRNGVGKTTTLRAVVGLVPRTGSIRLAGDEIGRGRTPWVVRQGVGYVPEDREVFATLTVAENLRLACPDPEPERAALVHELFPELSERSRQRAGTLSGGQQQMVALARALLPPSRLLLIDEPTKGLAPRLVTEVAAALERVAQVTPVLLVEQNLPVVRRLAEDVVVLDAGRVVHTGRADELLADAGRTRELLGVGSRS
ncbi:ABC transporter ATP-binding protein [Pseudonocardia sp. CA-142604]|uniref:ABC transporter ATP-binding protein n=1 Tax=Pseudonocardia sp. CA-142604 TaxID=3240024 RepID=UPI003D8DE98C